MSDDWAKRYIDLYKEKQQKKQEQRKKRQLAGAGAPALFQRIKDRIQQDLKTFANAGVLRSLMFRESPEDEFSVRDDDVRWLSIPPSLDVELEAILVKCHYRFPAEDGSGGIGNQVGGLRICSDLDGVLYLYNQKGEKLSDESEVAEFLLRPLLDFIDK